MESLNMYFVLSITYIILSDDELRFYTKIHTVNCISCYFAVGKGRFIKLFNSFLSMIEIHVNLEKLLYYKNFQAFKVLLRPFLKFFSRQVC